MCGVVAPRNDVPDYYRHTTDVTDNSNVPIKTICCVCAADAYKYNLLTAHVHTFSASLVKTEKNLLSAVGYLCKFKDDESPIRAHVRSYDYSQYTFCYSVAYYNLGFHNMAGKDSRVDLEFSDMYGRRWYGRFMRDTGYLRAKRKVFSNINVKLNRYGVKLISHDMHKVFKSNADVCLFRSCYLAACNFTNIKGFSETLADWAEAVNLLSGGPNKHALEPAINNIFQWRVNQFTKLSMNEKPDYNVPEICEESFLLLKSTINELHDRLCVVPSCNRWSDCTLHRAYG